MPKLIRYDRACRAVSEALEVDEVKEIVDKAEGMRAYAKQAKNKEMETDAAEIRLRGERRLGELLAEMEKNPGNRSQILSKTGGSSKSPPVETPLTLAEMGIDKKLSVRARKLAAVPKRQFNKMLGEWRERVEQENERVTVSLLRAGEQAQRDAGFAAKPMKWPDGKYGLIYADPPWRYENPPIGPGDRSTENHYPTMTVDEICALPISRLVGDSAILFMWATSPMLADCFNVLSAWGFNYRTNMVWVKDRIGMGWQCREKHELLLIAKRGELAPPEPADRPPSVIEAPRGRHSEKPAVFYDVLERMYPALPKIEMFQRGGPARKGWAVYGFESEEVA